MRAMNLKYIYTLLTLILALSFVPAHAQTKQKAKKQAAKIIKKTSKKGVVNQQKANAKNMGNAAAKVNRDTAKKTQPANTGGRSLSEEIVVTTAYKPVLADAVKIRRNPDLEDKTPFKAPLTYFPIDKRLELNTEIKPLDAMKRPAERDSALLNNYVKVGLGSFKTAYGEAYFNNGRDQALQVGAYAKHFAQEGSLYNQKSSREEAGVFGKGIWADNTLSGRATYNYNTNYFYGFDPTLKITNLQANKQHFSTIAGEAELAKNYKEVQNDFTYALKLKGYAWSNAFQAKENNVVLTGFLNETVNQFYAGVSGSIDVSTQQDSLYSNNNSLLRLNPYIKFQGTNYKIDAGINIVNQFGFNSAFYIFPAARLELQVIPKYVRIFLEAKGDVNRSSLMDFSSINPFLGQNISIQNSVDQLDISAGLKGTLAPGLGFKASVYRNSIKNMPLLVSDFNFAKGYNRFKVIYDNGRSRVSGFIGELDLKASDDLNLFGRVEFKDYQMATVAQPWNLPKFKLTAGTDIRISNTVDLTGSLLIRGSTMDPYPSATKTGTPTTVSSFADLSAGVQYKASKRFVVFVHINNVLNGTNQTWLYYPEYGFNVFGGVGFSF